MLRPLARNARFARRTFVSNAVLLQDQVIKVAPKVAPKLVTPPVKKDRPIRRFFIRLSLLTVLFYGAGSYASLKSEIFNDYFTEFVPFANELVQLIEENEDIFDQDTLTSLRSKIDDLKEKTISIPQEGAISEKVSSVYGLLKAKGEDLLGKASPSTESSSVASLPKLTIPTISYKTDNAEIQSVVDTLNSLVGQINSSGVSRASYNEVVAKFTASVDKISGKLKELEASKADILARLTEDFKKENQVALKTQENTIVSKFLSDFNAEVSKIKSHYEATLAKDIETTKQVQALEVENQLKAAKIRQQEKFESTVSEKIDAERNGKLKDLKSLTEKVDFLENFEERLFESYEKFFNYSQLNIVLNNLKKLVFSSESYQNNLQELNGKLILEELTKLQQLSSKDELLSLAVKAVPTDKIATDGIVSNSQLLQRWQLIVPELRSASLLPPNAGLLGHISAKFFSFFLIPKSGNVVIPEGEADKFNGNDIESIIARVNYNLANGDLDNAVESVSNLKGWCRKLSNDWLVEARRKLEVEFLVDLIETELKYSY